MFLIDRKNDKKRETCTGGRLTIDCSGCKGKASAEDRGCIACMCRAVNGHSDVESIMLHSGSDTSFQGESLTLIKDLAGVYSVLTLDNDRRKGSRCLACRNSYRHLVSDQLRCFPDVDTALLKQRASQSNASSGVCEICLSDSFRLFEHIESMISDIVGKREEE